jgi:hypothetical protein
MREQTGRAVNLRPGAYRARRLHRLDQFMPDIVAELQADPHVARVIFRAFGE